MGSVFLQTSTLLSLSFAVAAVQDRLSVRLAPRATTANIAMIWVEAAGFVAVALRRSIGVRHNELIRKAPAVLLTGSFFQYPLLLIT